MTVYLSLGTNLGDKEQNLQMAVQHIAERIGHINALSAFCITEPWGFDSDNSFLNAAVSVETDYSPHEVLLITQEIERELGRTIKSSDGQYHDRLIDIDLLLCDDIVLETPTLTIPHPLMCERLFVLEPLAQIAPDVLHPLQNITINQILLNFRQKIG